MAFRFVPTIIITREDHCPEGKKTDEPTFYTFLHGHQQYLPSSEIYINYQSDPYQRPKRKIESYRHVMATKSPIGWSNKVWDLTELTKKLDRILFAHTAYKRWAKESIVSINSLPPDEDDRTCPICSVPYGEATSEAVLPVVERPQKLPCGHHFGNFCLSVWFRTSKTCPLCRNKHTVPQCCDGDASEPLTQYMLACRQWLLWIIKRHGIPRAVALDREFQSRVRVTMGMSWEEWDSVTGNKGYIDYIPDIRKILQHHASEHYSDADQPAQDIDSPLLTWWGGPPKTLLWDAEFGDRSDTKAWEKLRYDRMVWWIRSRWDGWEMLFLSMAVGQITEEDLTAFEDDRTKGDPHAWTYEDPSKWRLSLTTDTLLYDEWLAI